MRHNVGYAASRIATFARELTDEIGPPLVATVGRVQLHPNLVNGVGSKAVLTVDIHHTHDAMLSDAERRLAAFCDEVCEREGVTIERRSLARFEPVAFAPEVFDLVANVADKLGYTNKRMPSGAGHDAQMLARVCPAGMVFVP